MKWFVLLLVTLSILPSCGGECEHPSPAVPPAPETECGEPPPDKFATNDADIHPDELQTPPDQSPRFAPNDRFGWPEEFLLPLIIEMDVPEVPESIRGPSAPIEDERK